MPEYIARGRLELGNVEFWVSADSEDEAREKFNNGVFDHWDISGSESLNWDIRTRDIEINA